jgi:TusA-related sulfurtransferase
MASQKFSAQAGPTAGPKKRISMNCLYRQGIHGPKTVRKLPFGPFFSQLASALLIALIGMSRKEPIDVFDLRDAIVPFSLLDIRHRFKQMRPGDCLVVLWSDPAAADDLMRVLPAACLEIVSKSAIPEASGGFRMELVKTRMEPTSTLGGISCHR